LTLRENSHWRYDNININRISREHFDAASTHRQQSDGLKVAVLSFGILVVLATITLLFVLLSTVMASTIPFDNDEANHALDGWTVYHALISMAPRDLLRAMAEQSFYPPVHSLFVAAGYLLAGPGLAASRLPTVVNFALTLGLLAWLTVQVSRWSSNDVTVSPWLVGAGATFAVACAITSEVYVLNAVLVMLEITGALFGLLLLLLAQGVDRARFPHERWKWIVSGALLATLIFLTKYSFGLFYLPAYLVALVAAPQLEGQRLARRNAMVVMAVYAAIIGSWLLVANRDAIWRFFVDHPAYAPFLSSENLLFLPRIWLERYSSTPALGVLTLLLAAIGAVRHWDQRVVRAAGGAVAAASLALTISTTNLARHFLPVAPAIWLLAGLGLIELLRGLRIRTGEDGSGIAMFASLAILLVIGSIVPASRLGAKLRAHFEGVPAYSAMQNFALQNVALEQPVLFVGEMNDQNGLLAVRWRAAVQARQAPRDLQIDYFPFHEYEYSLFRTARTPQKATRDTTFPRGHLRDVLTRNYYAHVVEFAQIDDLRNPSATPSTDPLCGYPAVQQQFADWVVIVYDTAAGSRTACVG